MGISDDLMEITIGEREYKYQVYYNSSWGYERVKLFESDGKYITEFPNLVKMREYLYHAEPDKVNAEIDAIKRFRESYESCTRKEYSAAKGKIEESEKIENQKAFTDRIGILMGDMNSNQFGVILGLNQGTVYNIVHGTRGVGMNILKRIADRCGVSIDWLLGG